MAERREAELRRAEAELAGVPDGLSRPPSRRIAFKVMLGVLVLLIIARAGAGRRPTAPDLAADCTKPAFKLSGDSVERGRTLGWTMVGPETKRYALAVDTLAFVSDGAGGHDAVPAPGREGDFRVGSAGKPLKGCRASGFFGLPITPGEHEVTMFELTGDSSVAVQVEKITVTEPESALD